MIGLIFLMIGGTILASRLAKLDPRDIVIAIFGYVIALVGMAS
jgi:hypothetical protein